MKESLINKLIPVDLHVHTPESKCYQIDEGLDIEEQYIDLLDKYIKNKIEVIAITDHNTIEGYKKLMDIRKKSIERVKIWSEIDDIEEVKNKISIELKKIEMFKSITILPGVEFEAYPGVHIVLIFNPNMDINLIENFIVENGYPKDKQGLEKVDISTTSAIDIITKARNLGAITIAAHVESSKGALTNIPEGSSRAQFFKSDSLMAIQVVNLKTIEYLKNLYRAKDYKRKKLPAFVRCSDFHNNISDIENYSTYMKLTDLSFESIVDAINNSIECISFTEYPENDQIIKRLVEEEYTYIFKDLSDESNKEIEQTICCILNEGQGTIVIGIGDNNEILGIKKEKSQCDKIINQIFDLYRENKAFFRYNVEYYDYGNHKVIVINLKSINKMIYNLNGKVYFKVKNSIKIAMPNDLVRLGEENFRENFKRINEINKLRIDKINNELNRLKKFEENINLYMKINNVSLTMRDIIEFDYLESNIKNSTDLENLFLGKNIGDTYFINMIGDPHREDCYLRITCPRTDAEIESIEDKIYKGECMLILPGGIVHYIDNNGAYSILNKIPILRVRLKREFEETYSLKCIVAWLKSPTLLAIVDLMYGDYDIFNPNILFNIPVPMNEISKAKSIIENKVIDIIEQEKKILEYVNCKFDNSESHNEIDIKINEHNKYIAEIASSIEEHFMKVLNINNEEDEIVNDFISNRQWNSIFKKLKKADN